MMEKSERLKVLRVEPTAEQREAARDFYGEHGDCFLAWVNEGDFIEAVIRAHNQEQSDG